MILIADDDPAHRDVTRTMLSTMQHHWLEAATGHEALELLQGPVGEDVSVVLLDLTLPDMNGLEVLKAIKTARADMSVIVLTGDGSVSNAVKSMQAGACDFLIKPVSPRNVEIAVRNATRMKVLASEVELLRQPSKASDFANLVSESPATKRAIHIAQSGAQSTIPILIEGESGVGKEVFARAIHASSERAGKPFVAVNCGALPENLVESILFGHEKGAFTGAVARRVGKFEEANDGVLFLDEIGELPLEAQVKLLRAIQEGEIDPIGGSRTVHTNIRLISATNRNLIAEVAAGRFREDLYYRIGVFPLHLPPLRDRVEDIPVLANQFAKQFAAQEGKDEPRISEQAMDLLCAAPWPGNIRQFENMIYRAVVLSAGDDLQVEDFAHVSGQTFAAQRTVTSGEVPQQSWPSQRDQTASIIFDEEGHIRPMAEIEKAVMEEALSRYDGSMSEAARRLCIGRSTLYRKLRGEEQAVTGAA
ncbi:MAG: sigma-54 dependent transcriptional regulator [Pseudomonadota bacterium]